MTPLAPVAAQEGGIEVFAGETLFEEGFRVSLTEIYKPKRDLFDGTRRESDPLNRSSDEYRTVLGIDYGLDRNATLSVLLPYVHRDLKAGGERTTASGLGDIALLGKYRFWRVEGPATSFNWSLIGGLEMPTGDTDDDDGGMRLPPSVQVGTGAWNPFLATSMTYGFGRARVDTTVFYKLNTEGAQKFEKGDFFSVSASAGYRFLHYKYPGPTFGARFGVQWRHEARDHRDNRLVTNSGADEIMLTPGLSVHPVPSVDFNIGARIPVYQSYGGTQLGRDVEWFVAVGLRF